jgi:hypothetical protein
MKIGIDLFTIFIGAFYLLGVLVLVSGVWAAWRSSQAAGWPTAPGKLTKADLKTESDSDGTNYEVQVEYTYQVAGQQYHGSRLAFGYSASSSYETHSQVLDKLKAAHSVDVRYAPGDPATACLSYGIHRSIQCLLAFSLFWIGFTAGFHLLWWLAMGSDSVLLRNLSVH